MLILPIILASTIAVPQELTDARLTKLANEINALRHPASERVSNPLALVKAHRVLRGLSKAQIHRVFDKLLKNNPVDTWVYAVSRTVFQAANRQKGWQEIDWWYFGRDRKKIGFNSVNFQSTFPIQYGGMYSPGKPTKIKDYLVKTSSQYIVRKNAIKMPDNPFELFVLPGADQTEYDICMVRAMGAAQLLKMASTVIEVDFEKVLEPELHEVVEYLEESHERFEAEGGKWDEKRMMYVKRDGSFRDPS